MTLQEMRAEVQRHTDIGLEHMLLVLPHAFKRPKGFPRGELMSETERRGRVYRFRCARVLKWLDAGDAQ